MRRQLLLTLGTIACASALVGAACKRERWPGVTPLPSPSTGATAQTETTQAAAPTALDREEIADLPAGGHPRILLTRERLDALEAASRSGAPSWRALVRQCDAAAKGSIDSGYQGEDWATAAVDAALCARVTHKPEYARAAAKYVTALVDDKETIGDRAGGLPAVKLDDGYPIRNRGFLAAIAYDWAYDDLTPEERKHAADRFVEFSNWYSKEGYKLDDPISNHFMSYFGATAMAGLALHGEDPRGRDLRKRARHIWRSQIVPAYRRLAGGDFPEGWQYARVPAAASAFYVDGEARATRAPVTKLLGELPWLRETVAFQTHALEPDGVHCWDNADWSKKPARPFPQQLFAAAIALPRDDVASGQALFLGRLAEQPDLPTWDWLQALADDPSRKGDDPRKGPTSYLARGTGTVFARTDWGRDAVWVAMNASPAFGDHQHLDQGHFEITRGADALVIDPGDYDSYSTLSHNSILVDDHGENDRWPPNQGVWGKTGVGVPRFADDAGVVYAEATFGPAYDPDGYPEDHPKRSVARAERELVFSRAPIAGATGASARVVLYDRVTVTKPSYGVAWAAHAGVPPQTSGATTRIALGRSSATIATLIPTSATPALLKEPTIHSDEMFTKNDPADGIASTRIEVASRKGTNERRFLSVIAIGGAADRPPAAVLVPGEGAEGAALDGEAYVFPIAGPQTSPAPIAWRAPVNAPRQIVTGLVAGARYAASASPLGDRCRVALTPGGDRAASAAGTMILDVRACAIAR